MRQQSEVQVRVRGKVIGGIRPLVCMPLMAADREALCREAAELAALQPDLLEWRVDAFSAGDDPACLAALRELRMVIGEIPLIFTCRIDREGGLKSMTQESRLALIVRAMQSGCVDIVDIELCNEGAFVDETAATAKRLGIKLILSHHDFQNTPDMEFLVERLSLAEQKGADIAKVAVMPRDMSDVLTLFQASNAARSGRVSIPMITIAMGEAGRISRLAGGLFGSDITFAAGVESSAPGQMAFVELQKGMALLYGE